MNKINATLLSILIAIGGYFAVKIDNHMDIIGDSVIRLQATLMPKSEIEKRISILEDDLTELNEK